METVCICEFDIISGYGIGLEAITRGLTENTSAIKTLNRFSTANFPCKIASCVDDSFLSADKGSMIIKALSSILKNRREVPEDINYLFASAKGEIDLLENSLRNQNPFPENFNVHTLNNIKNTFGFTKNGHYISAACASSSYAMAHASNLIKNGKLDAVLIITGDIITQFTFSGFSSLMSLDTELARPFDRNRKGLSLGDGFAWVLLMSEKRALKENRNVFGKIIGWGCSNDANHVTGPSRDGYGLSVAIKNAIRNADVSKTFIKVIKAHGTGTRYNDAMEIKAFASVFEDKRPVYSIKGGTGHMLGACGLIEMLTGLYFFHKRTVPGSLGFSESDDNLEGWVSSKPIKHDEGALLCTSSGFGGINVAIIVTP